MEDVGQKRRAVSYNDDSRSRSSPFLNVTNVSPHILHGETRIGMWLTRDQVPIAQEFVLKGYRIYAEWINLAYEATADQVDPKTDMKEEIEETLVETIPHEAPSGILHRPKTTVPVMSM